MNSAEAKLGNVVGGKYELETLLGQGGMGAVYRARHRVTGRRVAIKWLLEDDEHRRRRFLREARAMGRLAHPNVVQVFDVSDHEGEIFLVMEYLEGASLREFIEEKGVAPAVAIGLLMPALAGVEAAHQAGILHRDLKPENLFVCCDRDGTAYDTKVLDFGLAKATEAGADSKLTHTGAIVGTPRYMSPEQLEEKDVDTRTDVFSLGLILFELLVGELPYRAKSLNALLLEILTCDFPSPRERNASIPEDLAAVVEKAVARDPNERFETVAEFAKALEPFAEDVTFRAPRAVHSDSGEMAAPLTPSLDDEAISSSIRMRPSEPGISSPKNRSDEAFAETATIETPTRSRAKGPIWAVAGLAIAIALGVGGWLAMSSQPETTADTQPTDTEPADTQPTDAEPADTQPTDTEPADTEPSEPADTEPTDTEPTDTEPTPEVETPHRRGRRRGTRRTHETRTEPPPTETETAPRPTGVHGRSGTFRADDF